jgi:exosortase E/protease (VPEID-CTERM system)
VDVESSLSADSAVADWRRLAKLLPVRRLALLGVLFSVELAAITLYLDNDQIAGRSGLIALCHDWGPLLLRGIVVFATLFLTFACLRFSPLLIAISERMEGTPVSVRLIAAHAAALGLFAVFSMLLYQGHAFSSDVTAAIWLVCGLSAIGFGAAGFVCPGAWAQLARGTGYLWGLATFAALAAGFGGNAIRPLWPRATALTFYLVQTMLRPFGNFTGNPATWNIGSARFTVEIAPTCSGLEGIGLILVFTLVWLLLFKNECRFPQALVLLPLGVVILFLLNSARIAALILIGNAGFETIATGGFHSQAGWIAFNVVALGTSVAARQVSWFSRRKPAPKAVAVSNPTAPWVVPFVAILAAGMLSSAMTGSFEWFYPLRIIAVAVVLWSYRATYRTIDWRFDWTAPAAGLLVFAIWMALDRFGPGPMPRSLAAVSSTARFAWLAVRVIGATVTVPIAEELAFRGFLLRRFISADFEAISFRTFSLFALVASSVLFGMLHGQRWIAGTTAGLIFALVVTRGGRFGNAVIAHATANALIAVAVLGFGHWSLW